MQKEYAAKKTKKSQKQREEKHAFSIIQNMVAENEKRTKTKDKT